MDRGAWRATVHGVAESQTHVQWASRTHGALTLNEAQARTSCKDR